MSKKKPASAKHELRLPAIRIQQSPGRELFAFSVDGKLVPTFATVSRIQRSDAGALGGYQRPEQVAHINEIRTYLESKKPLLPNAVVIAFDKRVRFEPLGRSGRASTGELGTLIVPVDPDEAAHLRPGFIVDGQQRVAAIRESTLKAFPMCATGFIAHNIKEQTEQFILVNSTKPLPKGLIHELLPATQALLPLVLERRRVPAVLVTRLNEDRRSPLYRQIKTATNPEGRIKDNSLLRIIEASLSDGVLYVHRDPTGDNHDFDAMFRVLCEFFAAVQDVFPEEWALPPKRSRLTHGAGIAALGFIMDSVAHRVGLRKRVTRAQFARDLARLREHCQWTDGFWNFGSGQVRRWDELQNTSKDIELLVKYLAAIYKRRVVGET